MNELTYYWEADTKRVFIRDEESPVVESAPKGFKSKGTILVCIAHAAKRFERPIAALQYQKDGFFYLHVK